jgi:hypothetical protein
VTVPAEEVPPELPEPALGINFARDGMPEKDWLSLVAVHSDAWLIAVAFYFGARFGFDKDARSGHIFHSNVFNFFIKVLPFQFDISMCLIYLLQRILPLLANMPLFSFSFFTFFLEHMLRCLSRLSMSFRNIFL